jgi:hypothetical protein
MDSIIQFRHKGYDSRLNVMINQEYRDNDQIVCNLINSEDEYTSNIREI